MVSTLPIRLRFEHEASSDGIVPVKLFPYAAIEMESEAVRASTRCDASPSCHNYSDLPSKFSSLKRKPSSVGSVPESAFLDIMSSFKFSRLMLVGKLPENTLLVRWSFSSELIWKIPSGIVDPSLVCEICRLDKTF
jgi:hypothetical protein